MASSSTLQNMMAAHCSSVTAQINNEPKDVASPDMEHQLAFFKEAALEVDGDDSGVSLNSNITSEMIAEEEALAKETQEEEQKIKEAEAEVAQQQQEKRLKMLQHLLNKSQFYSQFIEQRLDQQKAAAIKEEEKAAAGAAKSSKRKRKVKVDRLANDKALLDARSASQGSISSERSPTPEVDMKATRVTDQGLVVSARQPLLFEGGVMRDYQLDGYDWLTLLYMNGVNGILADEMGLGKTIQCIALICRLIQKKLKGPFLIVGPLSTLSNWVSEFQRFAPKVPCMLYHGSQVERHALAHKLNERTRVPGFNESGVYPVVITSYEVAMKDRHPLQDRKWEIVVIDEGHRIKNFQCKLSKELKQYESNSRLLLTGTPLQNNLTELWSLLNYLLPDIFSNLAVFESWFEATDFNAVEGNLEETTNRIVQLEEKNSVISTLHKILHPFMLRRVKADVELNLPPKKELLVFTPMSPMQDEMYRALLNKCIHDLLLPEDKLTESTQTSKEAEKENENDEPQKKRPRRSCRDQLKTYYDVDHMPLTEYKKLLDAAENAEWTGGWRPKGLSELSREQGYIATINACATKMDMRKVVNHPYLLRFPLIPGTNQLKVDEELVTSSGKMMVLDAMLHKLKERGHKTLIFSQFTMMMDFIEDYLIMRGWRYCRLDGSRSVLDRKESIELFNTDPDVFCFLVSTRAGGLGINLTAADTVIIYDSDWNPQCDLQAQDRCHRIGQTRPVVVYRLTTDGTIDRRMVERATGKRRLEKMVIKKGQFQGSGGLGVKGSGFSAQELRDLLNSKDYVKSIQSNGYVFSDAELDELLDRSDLVSGQQTAAAGVKTGLFEVLN